MIVSAFCSTFPSEPKLEKSWAKLKKQNKKPQEILKSITSLGRDGILSSLKGGEIIKEVLHLINR